MDQPTKLLPEPTKVSTPFWEGTLKGELLFQKCDVCGHAQHPPREACIECWSDRLSWVRSTGKGTVYSFTVVRRATAPGFLGDPPYAVAIVELDEGPRMTTSIVGCEPEAVHIDMSVEAVFDRVSDQAALVKFQPRT